MRSFNGCGVVVHPPAQEEIQHKEQSDKGRICIKVMKTDCVHAPAAEEDVVGPDHGQREQVVQLLLVILAYIPQNELPPGLPVFLTLPVTSKRFHLVGHSSVLLNKVLHVQGRHLALLRPSRESAFLTSKRVPEVAFLLRVFSTAPLSGEGESCDCTERPFAQSLTASVGNKNSNTELPQYFITSKSTAFNSLIK